MPRDVEERPSLAAPAVADGCEGHGRRDLRLERSRQSVVAPGDHQIAAVLARPTGDGREPCPGVAALPPGHRPSGRRRRVSLPVALPGMSEPNRGANSRASRLALDSSSRCSTSKPPMGRPGFRGSPQRQADRPRRWGQRSASGWTPTIAASRLRRVRKGATPARAGSTRSTRSARPKARSQEAGSGSIAIEIIAMTFEEGRCASQARSTTGGLVPSRRDGSRPSNVVTTSSVRRPSFKATVPSAWRQSIPWSTSTARRHSKAPPRGIVTRAGSRRKIRPDSSGRAACAAPSRDWAPVACTAQDLRARAGDDQRRADLTRQRHARTPEPRHRQLAPLVPQRFVIGIGEPRCRDAGRQRPIVVRDDREPARRATCGIEVQAKLRAIAGSSTPVPSPG